MPEPAPTEIETDLKVEIDPAIVATLRTAGFTPTNLPADLDELHEAGHKRMRAIMKTFTIALGTTCEGCHAKGANEKSSDELLGVDTPRKRVAKKMWTEFVVALQRNDGSAVYCDTCHQGQMKFLARGDGLDTWMDRNFVAELKRKNGRDHSCATCHGEPFTGSLLDTWRESP